VKKLRAPAVPEKRHFMSAFYSYRNLNVAHVLKNQLVAMRTTEKVIRFSETQNWKEQNISPES